MTYTVKNGTWCKDNEKEYYSTTRTGLKAALKAGEITAGTKVVVHEPRQPAGTLIQSLNPNPPEGFFVPDGSAFDTDVYTDLAALFPDGKLPDLRECVLVMAGRSERAEITRHDEYTAGEFKDDQFAEHAHDITDPGHEHEIPCGGYGNIGDGGDSGSVNTYTSQGYDTSTKPAITGITINAAGTGDVTHGKQVGVYYYIAF